METLIPRRGFVFDSPEAREKAVASAREKVRGRALAGYFPRDTFDAESLEFAFASHEDELAELEATVTRRREAESKRYHETQALLSMIETVRREKDAEREREIRAEAQRRLGLD